MSAGRVKVGRGAHRPHGGGGGKPLGQDPVPQVPVREDAQGLPPDEEAGDPLLPHAPGRLLHGGGGVYEDGGALHQLPHGPGEARLQDLLRPQPEALRHPPAEEAGRLGVGEEGLKGLLGEAEEAGLPPGPHGEDGARPGKQGGVAEEAPGAEPLHLLALFLQGHLPLEDQVEVGRGGALGLEEDLPLFGHDLLPPGEEGPGRLLGEGVKGWRKGPFHSRE